MSLLPFPSFLPLRLQKRTVFGPMLAYVGPPQILWPILGPFFGPFVNAVQCDCWEKPSLPGTAWVIRRWIPRVTSCEKRRFDLGEKNDNLKISDVAMVQESCNIFIQFHTYSFCCWCPIESHDKPSYERSCNKSISCCWYAFLQGSFESKMPWNGHYNSRLWSSLYQSFKTENNPKLDFVKLFFSVGYILSMDLGNQLLGTVRPTQSLDLGETCDLWGKPGNGVAATSPCCAPRRRPNGTHVWNQRSQNTHFTPKMTHFPKNPEVFKLNISPKTFKPELKGTWNRWKTRQEPVLEAQSWAIQGVRNAMETTPARNKPTDPMSFSGRNQRKTPWKTDETIGKLENKQQKLVWLCFLMCLEVLERIQV